VVAKPKKRALFEEEILPELDVLFASALYLTRDEEEANDLCEKTMLQAYRSFDRLPERANRRTWLLAILNEVVRSTLVETAAEFQIHGTPPGGEAPAILETPDRSANKPDVDRSLDRALQSLPYDCKAAVVLVDVAELPYREAARILEVSTDTLRERISRGRALMRQALASFARIRGLARA
jgi:RNA polymerase sigma factor (sigma-70 family)